MQSEVFLSCTSISRGLFLGNSLENRLFGAAEDEDFFFFLFRSFSRSSSSESLPLVVLNAQRDNHL